MRQIAVDTDTFSLIWAARRPGEESENAIISRVFKQESAAKTRVDSDGGKPLPKPASDASRKQVANLRDGYWWQVVHYSLESLGKPSTLSDIYKVVISVCKECGRKMPTEIEATVRGTLEDNSSDSERFKQVRDVFCMPEGSGAGVWGLRIWQEQPKLSSL
jgi:hypothetical protein